MKALFLSIIATLLGSLASADTTKSTAAFTDGTKVEVVGLPAPSGEPTTTNLVQIKQTDGTICYAVVQFGNNSSFPNSISCLRP